MPRQRGQGSCDRVHIAVVMMGRIEYTTVGTITGHVQIPIIPDDEVGARCGLSHLDTTRPCAKSICRVNTLLKDGESWERGQGARELCLLQPYADGNYY